MREVGRGRKGGEREGRKGRGEREKKENKKVNEKICL
jgi:hypothetical protein